MSFPSVTPPSQNENVFQMLRTSTSRKQTNALHQNSNSDNNNNNNSNSDNNSNNNKKQKNKIRPGSYEALGLNGSLCKALSTAGYNFPTPIQRKVIPEILKGKDIVAMARTGSGKTAAFLAPLIQLLTCDDTKQSMTNLAKFNGPRMIVIAPTRELALQEMKFFNVYSKFLAPQHKLRYGLIVGGTALDIQFKTLTLCPDILFVTPGRFLHLVHEMNHTKKIIDLSVCEYLVLDEADRLFEGTLLVETMKLLNELNNGNGHHNNTNRRRQNILVSATMPYALIEFSKTGLNKSNLKVIRLNLDKSISNTVSNAFLHLRSDSEKDSALFVLLRKYINEDKKQALVFTATHKRVEYLVELLRRRNLFGENSRSDMNGIGFIHGNMDQVARQETVSKFRKKKFHCLVVTDVAARGIDIPDLDVVINYDMPSTPKLFIHRIGRVGRAGKFGITLNFVSFDELPYMMDIFLYISHEIQLARGDLTSQNSNNEDSEQVRCMNSNYILGTLPKAVMDEEIEIVKSVIENHLDIDKLQRSARNAHKLYVKTRNNAGGESVRRAKSLFFKDDQNHNDQLDLGMAKEKKVIHVHPWFAHMENKLEQQAIEQVTKLASWRPKECVVKAPNKIIARKEALKQQRIKKAEEEDVTGSEQVDNGSERKQEDTKEREEKEEDDDDEEGEESDDSDSKEKDEMDIENDDENEIQKDKKEREIVAKNATKKNNKREKVKSKVSSKQAELEEERRRFFMPTRLDANRQLTERSINNNNNNEMGAYRELHDAAMDINMDGNVDLLRAKHLGSTPTSTSAKYWDRIQKKFVRGVTDKTSKQNTHVASREARMRDGQNYSSDNGKLFKNWLNKNRKSVEELSQRMEEGNQNDSDFHNNGLGNSNDFRKGAFGRRSRVIQAGKRKNMAGNMNDNQSMNNNQNQKYKNELKPVEQIKKERTRQAKIEKYKKGHKKNNNSNNNYPAPQKGISKSRVIIRSNNRRS